MKLLYLSCHSILEYDELSLFTELGIECFSMGAYTDPAGHKTLPRPGIKGMKPHSDLETLSTKFPKTNLPQDLIDWADVIMVMHQPEWITENWDRMKHKKVIWRSIGQSTREVENMIRKPRYEGLKIVRYSPMERNVPDFIGEDAMIRFYKDPSDFAEWNGKEKRLINLTQSLKGRRALCHYDEIMAIMNGYPSLIFGTGNDDLGAMNGGELPYELMKGQLRDNGAFVYGGTWPASYTLSFIEAWMTGIPILAIGPRLAEELNAIPPTSRMHFYEIPSLITPGQDGFVSDSIEELRYSAHLLLEDSTLAKRISDAGRLKAIEVFGKEPIKKEWKKFFDEL